MPITEATIKTAKLFPERLPDAVIRSVAAPPAVTTAIIDQRRFYPPRMLQIDGIGVEGNDNVELRLRADAVRLEGNTTSALPGVATAARYKATARDYLFLTLFSTAVITDYRLWYSLWVWEPTVADKLKYGISLNPDDQRINRDLGISKAVEKGILPAPHSYIIERQFQVINEETIAWRGPLTAGTAVEIARVVPRVDEFLVLSAVAADAPPLAADNVHLLVDRDNDTSYLDLVAFSLGTTSEIPCFVPALRELRFSVSSSAAIAGYKVRLSYLRCKMTNIIRARFNLVPREELPEPAIWDKVRGGIA